MRASEQEQKGAAGVNEVKSNFERIGWGAIENTQHDSGTDLILIARDQRLFEPGTMAIGQVKSGSRSAEVMRWRLRSAVSKAFANPVKDRQSGEVVGWWFYESTEHVQAWIGNQLAAILVLHDLDDRQSYWAHVSAQTVQYTKKQAKIFVPLANTVDDAHLDQLLAVASSKADGYTWEGTAWAGVDHLSSTAQLRHALLAPRLVAPHPNRRIEASLSGTEAIALTVRGRLHDLSVAAEEHTRVPALNEVGMSHDWEWQLASVIGGLLTEGTYDRLESLAGTAPKPHQRAAAVATRAACLIEDGAPEVAQVALETALEPDDLDPIDHGWLRLQHARACAELGLSERASESAAEAVRLRVAYPDDLTASAIAGAAAGLLFDIADWESEDLASAIAGADTAVAWWRQQEMAWGLSALADDVFVDWGRDRAVTWRVEDRVWRHLRSASLLAGFLGAHSAWRGAYGQIGEYELSQSDRWADPDHAAENLRVLIASGEAKSVRLAARRLASDGPARAVAVLVSSLDPALATRTSALSVLAALTAGGSMLRSDRADAVARWCLNMLSDSGRTEWVKRVRPHFLVDHEVLHVLHALTPAVSPPLAAQIAEHVLDHAPITHELTARDWASVVDALPVDVWDGRRSELARERVGKDHFPLDYSMLKVAASTDPTSRERLMTEAREGSLPALSALGSVTALDREQVLEITSHLEPLIREEVAKARAGRGSFGGESSASALCLLNLWHPEEARWAPVLELIEERDADIAGTRYVLEQVAERFSELDEATADSFVHAARAVADGPAPPSLFANVDPRPAARQILVSAEARSGRDPKMLIVELASGHLEERVAAARAARVVPDETMVLIIRPMLSDPDPRVRAAAARSVASFVTQGVESAATLLGRIAADPGAAAPRAAVAGLRAGAARLDEFQAAPWRDHPDARVRALVEDLTVSPEENYTV